MGEREYCSVVMGNCRAPAGFQAGGGVWANEEGPYARAACFACGDPVCTNPDCSQRVRYRRFGRRRLCRWCIEEEA